MADWRDWAVLFNSEFFIKAVYVVIFVICCPKEVHASIVLDIERVQLVLQDYSVKNCKIISKAMQKVI